MISLSTFSARIDNTIAALRVAESYPVSEREQLLQLLASEFHGGHLSSLGPRNTARWRDGRFLADCGRC